MLSDSPLWTFEIEVVYICDRFWLVEWCVMYSGERSIVEMVEIEGNLDDYLE